MRIKTKPIDVPHWMRFYVLDHRDEPVRVYDAETWMNSQLSNPLRSVVAQTALPGHVKVITVFVGMTVNWTEASQPPLFETAVTGGRLGGFTQRWYTWDEARAGHRSIVLKCGVLNTFKVMEDA